MTPQQIASARAHELLAELIELDVHLTEKVVAKALSKKHGKQVVIFYAPWEPVRFFPATGPDRDANGWPIKKTDEREICSCIMQAAPNFHEKPITMRKLARLAGYGYTNHFRHAVAELVDAGKLIRSSRGFRKSS